MNVFRKIALASLKKNRARTLVTIIGVMLSAGLIAGVMSFGFSLLTTLQEGTALRYGDWHLAVKGADSGFVAAESANPAIQNVIAVDEYGVHATSRSREVRLLGFGEETFNQLPLTLVSGRLPRTETELILRDGALDIAVGENVTLTAADGAATSYTVVGIIAHPSFVEKDTGFRLAIAYRTAFDETSPKTVFLRLTDPYATLSYRKTLPYESYINSKLLRYMGIWEDSGDSMIVTLMISISVVVIAIIMTGSVFLIFNAFHISMNERMHQNGLLASIGATPAQIRSTVLYEGLFIGAIGIPLGTIAGVGAIQLVILATRDSFHDIFPLNVTLRLCLSPTILVLSVIVSFITILISAHIPAKKAARLPVMDCLRKSGAIAVPPRAVKTSRLTEKLLGLPGTLALKNFRRNRRQYRSVILSLILSIVLFITTATFTGVLGELAASSALVTDYQVGFGSHGIEDEQLIALLDDFAAVDGVETCRLQAVYDLACHADAATTFPGVETLNATVQFVDEDTFRAFVQELGLNEEAYLGETAHFLTVAKRPNDKANSIEELENLFLEKTVPVRFGETEVLLTSIDRLLPDIPPTEGVVDEGDYPIEVLAPWRWKPALHEADALRIKGITVITDSAAAVRARLQAIIESRGVAGSYYLIDCGELLNSNNSLARLAKLFSYTFIAMITLIALANVFNTVSTNIRLRRRELAMLRSIGMGEKAFDHMMRTECVFYGLKALLYGLPLSMLLSYGIQKVIREGATNTDFVLPSASVCISVVGVFLMVFLTMRYTLRQVRSENLIDALRDELA